MKLRIFDELPEGEEYLFHSTTAGNAAQILVTCPFPGMVRPRMPDFDSGIYMNVSGSAALDWAKRVAKSNKHGAVVMVFKIPPEHRALWKELKLTEGPEWSRLIQAFRTGRMYMIDIQAMSRRFNVISGPTLKNVWRVIDEGTPMAHDFQQVCVLSPSLAAGLNQHLVGFMCVPADEESETFPQKRKHESDYMLQNAE